MVVVLTIIGIVFFVFAMIPVVITLVKSLVRLAKVKYHKKNIDKNEKATPNEDMEFSTDNESSSYVEESRP